MLLTQIVKDCENFSLNTELSLTFWMRFDQLLSIFHGISQIQPKFDKFSKLFWQYLAYVFVTFTELKERLWNLMKFNEI